LLGVPSQNAPVASAGVAWNFWASPRKNTRMASGANASADPCSPPALWAERVGIALCSFGRPRVSDRWHRGQRPAGSLDEVGAPHRLQVARNASAMVSTPVTSQSGARPALSYLLHQLLPSVTENRKTKKEKRGSLPASGAGSGGGKTRSAGTARELA
jgi:hypothetical protein